VHLEVSTTGELTVEDRKAAERYAPVGGIRVAADAGDLDTASPAPGLDPPELLPARQTVVSAGPLVGSVETRWSASLLGHTVFTVRQLVVLHADSPVIRLRWDIDFQGSDLLLRAGFPIAPAAQVVAGSALGSTHRGPASPASAPEFEAPSPTAPAHRYVTAGTAGRRLTLVAPGFFEYEWTADGTLELTLLRSAGALSRQDLPERPGHAAWPQPTPAAQEQGLHVIRIALAAGQVDPEAAWEEVFLPPQTLQVGAPMSLG
jgi:alpha-mannosidase